MQKQKINFHYLIIQSNYTGIEIALCDKEQILKKIFIDKKYSSKNLIPDIENILKNTELEIDQISFIGVNQGPGPFTTLRVAITTANALNFALKIPLVSINGLEIFLQENKSKKHNITVAILNAFNNDVYFGILLNIEHLEIGCKNIDLFLKELQTSFGNQKIEFIGSGINFFESNIKDILKDNFYISEPLPLGPSLEALAKASYSKWLSKQDITQQVIPLYLKDAIIKKEA